MKYHYASFIIFLSFFVCCQRRGSSDSDYQTDSYIDSAAEHRYALYDAKVNDELNLQQLDHSVDSFELRLSTTIAILKLHYGQMLVIKKQAQTWKCWEYNYIFRAASYGSNEENYLNQFAIDTIWIYKKQPKSNWKDFFKKIGSEGIYTLPDRKAIDKSLDSLHVSIADGTVYSIEFVNGKQCRRYGFNSPQDFVNNIPACRHMANIIQIFDEEFGVADDDNEIVKRLPESVIHNYDTALQHLIREMKARH